MAERLPLTHLPAALNEAGYSDLPSYRQMYELARSNRLPGVKPNKAGRWTINPEDIAAIASAMGLTDAHAA